MSSRHQRPRVAPRHATLGDDEFDDLLPTLLQVPSEIHFTPAHVVLRATQLLVTAPGTRVLDVGAGVGKFCIVGGTAVPDAIFVGVERRPYLVEIASSIARGLSLPNVSFVQGDAVELDWTGFDAFYLYNPFAEHLRDNTPMLDDTIELDPAYFRFYVTFVRERLSAARIGTRVVTYHGFGGPPPPGYVVACDQDIGSGRLELWIKTRSSGRRAARRTSE